MNIPAAMRPPTMAAPSSPPEIPIVYAKIFRINRIELYLEIAYRSGLQLFEIRNMLRHVCMGDQNNH
jgi:hypothetical protein